MTGSVKERYDRRIAAMHDLADSERLDAMIVPGRGVITQYGFLQWIAGYCPVIRQAAALMIGADPAVLAVTSGSDVVLAKESSPITEIVQLDSLAGDLGSMLQDLLATFEAPRIGVVGLADIVSANMIDAWRSALPAASFIDITVPVLRLKSVKDEEEQAAMHAVAATADDALAAIIARLRIDGATLADAAAQGDAVLRTAGAHETLIYVSKGPHFLHRPTLEKVDPGDLITIYVELSDADGYWIELARVAARGLLSPGMSAIVETTQQAMAETRNSLFAGNSAGKARDAIAAVIEEAGYRSGLWLGHGVGIDHDLPVIGKGETMLLESGMTIAVHPHLANDHGGASIGDTLIVSEAGGVALSRWPTDIILI